MPTSPVTKEDILERQAVLKSRHLTTDYAKVVEFINRISEDAMITHGKKCFCVVIHADGAKLNAGQERNNPFRCMGPYFQEVANHVKEVYSTWKIEENGKTYDYICLLFS